MPHDQTESDAIRSRYSLAEMSKDSRQVGDVEYVRVTSPAEMSKELVRLSKEASRLKKDIADVKMELDALLKEQTTNINIRLAALQFAVKTHSGEDVDTILQMAETYRKYVQLGDIK